MNLPKETHNSRKPKYLLGNKINDVIKQTKKIPSLIYNFKRGKCYVFTEAPFKTIYVEDNIIHGIDEIKDSRREIRYSVDGLVFAAPDGNTDYTIVGDLINISKSAVCIKPYKTEIFPDCTWKLHIDLGNSTHDTYGTIVRKDNKYLVFKFVEKLIFVELRKLDIDKCLQPGATCEQKIIIEIKKLTDKYMPLMLNHYKELIEIVYKAYKN